MKPPSWVTHPLPLHVSKGLGPPLSTLVAPLLVARSFSLISGRIQKTISAVASPRVEAHETGPAGLRRNHSMTRPMSA